MMMLLILMVTKVTVTFSPESLPPENFLKELLNMRGFEPLSPMPAL